jgi:5-formyltetrahydrofolate cyclo-ligase
MTVNVAEAKAALRKQVLSKRSNDQAAELAESFGKRLLQLSLELEAKTVGVYLSFGSEPATDTFVVLAKSNGIQLAAPRTGPESSMEFGLLEGPSSSSPLGFLQPVGDVIEPGELDLIIAPALSIDRGGNRLGRGGGFFDRYLDEYEGTVAAVVYDSEFVSELPVESHDKPVQYVITESQIQKLPATR